MSDIKDTDTGTLNTHKSVDFEALRKAHPEVYGDDPAPAADVKDPADHGTPNADAKAGDAVDDPAAKPAAVVDDKAGAGDKPVPDKTTAPMIPKARFDEVLGESKHKDQAIAERDARIAELEKQVNPPATPRDFDAEHEALRLKYKDGDLDSDEYAAEQRKLNKEELRFTAEAIADKRIVELAQKQAALTAEEEFAKADTAWRGSNAEFLAVEGARQAMETALEVVDKQHGYKLAPAELFEKAAKVAQAIVGAPAPAPAATDTGAGAAAEDPHKARNAHDATQQARAGAAPADLAGGMGDRGNALSLDLGTLKQGQFGKLSEADQNKALGIT